MTQAQPLIQTLPMTLGAPMSDDPSNPTAIEIPLQIELPNGQTLFAAVALGGLPFDGQRQIAERIAAAWNAFTGVTIEEIKAPVKCLLQITEPAPTESVLIDGTAYVVHAEVAAELLRLHIELQTAPQAVQATEEMRVCNSEECGWIGPLSETYGYKHSPATLCPECKETTELSAPAHPAEGVPAHELIDWDSAHKIAFQAAAAFRPSYFKGAGFVAHNWVVEAIRSAHIDGQRHAMGLPTIDRSASFAEELRKERASTQPAAQGLEQDAERWGEVLRHVGAAPHFGGQHFTLNTLQAPDTALGFKANLMSGSVAQHFTKAIDASLAAQAKQGGAA